MTEYIPKPISLILKEVGFKLPGRENHIPLGLEPYKIYSNQYQDFLDKLPLLAEAFLAAYNFFQGRENSYPFIWRFDFLATPHEKGLSEPHNYRLLELNGTRPGGMWLLNKAREAYRSLGINGNFWMPEIDHLGNFFRKLAKRNSDRSQLVALGYTPGYVAEIEMPQLAQLLDNWAKENGYNLSFTSGPRESFLSTNGYILSSNGEIVSLFYENAAPQDIEGRRIDFLFSQQENPGTVIINPPELAGIDNKKLMAVLSSDNNFRRTIHPAVLPLIDELLPTTFFIPDSQTLTNFIGKPFFLKITDGIRGSSGKGVYNLACLDNEIFEEIKELIENGHQFVAQQTIPPDNPWYQSIIIEDGQPARRDSFFVDLDPYLVSDGQEIEVIGALCRAKPTHPINITQGGALFGVVIV